MLIRLTISGIYASVKKHLETTILLWYYNYNMKILKDTLLGHDGPDPLFKYTWGDISHFVISRIGISPDMVCDQVKTPVYLAMVETNEVS